MGSDPGTEIRSRTVRLDYIPQREELFGSYSHRVLRAEGFRESRLTKHRRKVDSKRGCAGRYLFRDDDRVSAQLASASGLALARAGWLGAAARGTPGSRGGQFRLQHYGY